MATVRILNAGSDTMPSSPNRSLVDGVPATPSTVRARVGLLCVGPRLALPFDRATEMRMRVSCVAIPVHYFVVVPVSLILFAVIVWHGIESLLSGGHVTSGPLIVLLAGVLTVSQAIALITNVPQHPRMLRDGSIILQKVRDDVAHEWAAVAPGRIVVEP
jgi:hypothetical protein